MRCCQRVVEQGAEATTDIATAGTEAEATVARLGLVVVPAVRRWVVGRLLQLFCLQPYLLLLFFVAIITWFLLLSLLLVTK